MIGAVLIAFGAGCFIGAAFMRQRIKHRVKPSLRTLYNIKQVRSLARKIEMAI
jgi:hypothetical protein